MAVWWEMYGLCDDSICVIFLFILFFFFNDTATTEIYTLSLHDALPISKRSGVIFRYFLVFGKKWIFTFTILSLQ